MTIRSALLLAAALLAPLPAAAADPTDLVVFGDSLVDAGNVFTVTGGANPPASQGYFQGRFTNGYDFTDYLSIALTGAPTVASLQGGNNWGWGGARGTGVGGFPVPGLPQQIAEFAVTGPRGAGPDSLYVLNFGGNDVFALESGDTVIPPDQFAALYITNMTNAVQFLADSGARNILVMGVPNTSAVGLALDAQLQAALDGIEAGFADDTTLFRFSYAAFYGRLLSNPASYGFNNGIITDTFCLAEQTVVDGQVDCGDYFSFDGIHFTTKVHQGIYRDLVQALAVPEPATWALMIGGFGLIGGALRRNRAHGVA